MSQIATHREIAKPGARNSVGRDGSGNTTDGGQDKRPRGAARLGDGRSIDIAGVSRAPSDVWGHHPTSRTRKFSNFFNEYCTSRGTGDESQ